MKKQAVMLLSLLTVSVLVLLSACPIGLDNKAAEQNHNQPPAAAQAPKQLALNAATKVKAWDQQVQLKRAQFNRLISLEAIPLHWLQGALSPANMVEFAPDTLRRYVTGDRFNTKFDKLYAHLLNRRRLEALRRELNSGRVTAIVTDLRQASAEDRALVRSMSRVARLIEKIFARQLGTAAIGQEPVESEGRELLRRSQGYWCKGPQTRDDPFCNALASFPQRRSDAYPPDSKQDAAFCEQLRKSPNAKALMAPFSVVRRRQGKLIAVSYLDVYGDDMRAIAQELDKAAQNLGADEAALRDYLRAAAQSFRSNNWDAADEAWVKMNASNSKWYLRVGPDEVYVDPCNSKAGFHLSFAKINPTLAGWSAKLSPLREQMEKEFAKHIGAPYKARQVSFDLPAFIDVVLNAGDSRDAFGATVGQSLPNWGPVSERGDGRTVVMTNFYSGPDSLAVARQKALLLLDPASLARLDAQDPGTRLLDVLLHEATHNFGPTSDYRIDGKAPREIFGGLSASILEELKAQTGALWYIGLLQKQKVIDDKTAASSLTGSIMWCFGQMSRGLYARDGKRQVYPSLAAIQVGYFLQHGGLSFDPKMKNPGSDDKGRFVIDISALQKSADELMRVVGQIKARGDKAAADALIAQYTDAAGQTLIHENLVQQRVLRFAKESFSYAIRY